MVLSVLRVVPIDGLLFEIALRVSEHLTCL